MKKFKLKIKHDFAEALEGIIGAVMQDEYRHFDDKLIVSGLAEIKEKLYKKLCHYQSEYTMSLTPVQAISLYLFVTTFSVYGINMYAMSGLQQISNAIHQQFQ